MIRESELHEAIAECRAEKNPNANTCMKLASYYTILDHMPSYSHKEPPEQVRYNSGSEFSNAIQREDINRVLDIMDELMDALKVLSPRLYRATLNKIIM